MAYGSKDKMAMTLMMILMIICVYPSLHSNVVSPIAA